MVTRFGRMTLVALALLAATALEGQAQSLGTFRFQLQPYCNVVAVNITQNGSVYTLDGYDDQCGATQRASVVGMALLNPDGTVGFGMTIVAAPGGTPTQVYATASPVTGNGSWRDGAGASGAFVLTPGASTGGSLRPLPPSGLPDGSVTSAKILDGTVGASDINAAQVQQRVAGACATGQLMTGVNQDGTVVCEAVTSGAGGDITGVTAGNGLTGGGQTGAVTLNVSFAGPGTTSTAARSDHTHAALGLANTQVGEGALVNLSTGQGNTAVGRLAMASTKTGENNSGIGWFSLENNVIGHNNTALGTSTLRNNVDNTENVAVGVRAGFNGGSGNTAVGYEAIRDSDTDGTIGNTAVGYKALRDANTDFNTAVGHQALALMNTGTNNAALGVNALGALTIGDGNVAAGAGALDSLDNGDDNVAIGQGAGQNITAGSRNILIGVRGGVNLLGGSDNVYLGSFGVAGDSGTIRLGRLQTTRAFVGGVSGVTTGANNAVNVVVDSNGQLGTVSSSRKTKFDIADLDMSVTGALQRLRPVQFRYLKPFADGSTPIQYGLIAEEVQDVLPELVALDDDGQPASVKYHILPSLLLAEVQRLSRELAALQSEFAALAAARR